MIEQRNPKPSRLLPWSWSPPLSPRIGSRTRENTARRPHRHQGTVVDEDRQAFVALPLSVQWSSSHDHHGCASWRTFRRRGWHIVCCLGTMLNAPGVGIRPKIIHMWTIVLPSMIPCLQLPQLQIRKNKTPLASATTAGRHYNFHMPPDPQHQSIIGHVR